MIGIEIVKYGSQIIIFPTQSVLTLIFHISSLIQKWRILKYRPSHSLAETVPNLCMGISRSGSKRYLLIGNDSLEEHLRYKTYQQITPKCRCSQRKEAISGVIATREYPYLVHSPSYDFLFCYR